MQQLDARTQDRAAIVFNLWLSGELEQGCMEGRVDPAQQAGVVNLQLECGALGSLEHAGNGRRVGLLGRWVERVEQPLILAADIQLACQGRERFRDDGQWHRLGGQANVVAIENGRGVAAGAQAVGLGLEGLEVLQGTVQQGLGCQLQRAGRSDERIAARAGERLGKGGRPVQVHQVGTLDIECGAQALADRGGQQLGGIVLQVRQGCQEGTQVRFGLHVLAIGLHQGLGHRWVYQACAFQPGVALAGRLAQLAALLWPGVDHPGG